MSEAKIYPAPLTFEDATPADMVGRLVNVRPYYHVPSGRSSLMSTRSPWVQEARVIETFGTEMVLIRFTWDTTAPWNRQAIFYPRELHNPHTCGCAACKGDGTHDQQNGA